MSQTYCIPRVKKKIVTVEGVVIDIISEYGYYSEEIEGIIYRHIHDIHEIKIKKFGRTVLRLSPHLYE